jgi:hypothetical protein
MVLFKVGGVCFVGILGKLGNYLRVKELSGYRK